MLRDCNPGVLAESNLVLSCLVWSRLGPLRLVFYMFVSSLLVSHRLASPRPLSLVSPLQSRSRSRRGLPNGCELALSPPPLVPSSLLASRLAASRRVAPRLVSSRLVWSRLASSGLVSSGLVVSRLASPRLVSAPGRAGAPCSPLRRAV